MAGEIYRSDIARQRTGMSTVNYVLENPVRAGIVADPDDYPYCGILDPL